MKARKAVRKAIQNQMEGKGFSLVEILSPCPVQWGKSPEESCRWILETMVHTFPLAVFKDSAKPPDQNQRDLKPKARPSPREVARILGERKDEGPPLETSLPPSPAQDQNPRMIISGFGGQGGLFLGEILAEAGMSQGYQVSWLPSYGPEMRGGTAHCHVIISREAIDSPLVDRPTTLIALNEPSLVRFAPKTIAGGLLIYDSSLVTTAPSRRDLETIAIPATAIADKLGNAKGANMVILGAYLAKTKFVAQDTITRTLAKRLADKALLEYNLKAIDAGREFLTQGRN
jgi:Pyruvate/2-oxoacid:ferredoxin oxidoreductase gamma subunit